MNHTALLRLLFVFLAMQAISIQVVAQQLLLRTTFDSPAAFEEWTVVDANDDGVTWTYDATASPGNAAYGYHPQYAADDWLVSPALVATSTTTLLVQYAFYGSFYSEGLELYRVASTHVANAADVELISQHEEIKDKRHEGFAFLSVEKGEVFHLAFRACSPANKLRLSLLSVEVRDVSPQAGAEYPHVAIADNGLTLAASHRYVQYAAGEEVRLALYDGTSDVTDDVTFFQITPDGVTHPLTSPTTMCNEPGTHRFYANYADKTTADHLLDITVLQSMPALPADPQPQSNDFVQQVLLTQGTGLRCQYCPKGIAAIHNFYESHPMAKQVVHMALHAFGNTDPLSSTAAFLLYEQLDLGGFPNMIVNYNPEWKDSGLATAQFEELITTAVDKALAQKSQTALAVATEWDESRGVISVSVGVKVAQAGLYRLSVALVQDNVYLPQSGTNNEAYYMHHSSIRALAPADGEGAWLNGRRAEVAEAIYPYHCEFNTSDLLSSTSYGYTLDVCNDARVVVYTQKMDGTIDNVVVCGIDESLPFAYNSEPSTPPTVGIEHAVLPESGAMVRYTLYDMAGRRCAQGAHWQQVQSTVAPGVYLLQERKGQVVTVKKIGLR